MRKEYSLDDLRIYKEAMELGEAVWKIVMGWDEFSRRIVGGQFVRAVDSVAANIAEGFGRGHTKEQRHFYFIARGSLYESRSWLSKALSRGLLDFDLSMGLSERFLVLEKMLNKFISYHKTKS